MYMPAPQLLRIRWFTRSTEPRGFLSMANRVCGMTHAEVMAGE